MPIDGSECRDCRCSPNYLQAWFELVLRFWTGTKPRHEVVLHQRAREQPVCRRGGNEHPVEGTSREALWGCSGRVEQFARHHTWRLLRASPAYCQVRGGSVSI